MRKLVIFGSGGFARQVHQIVEDLNNREIPKFEDPRWKVLGFLNDDPSKTGMTLHDLPVLGGSEWLFDNPKVDVVIAIGNPADRKKVVQRLALPQDRLPRLVHPLAWVGNRIEMGPGTIIAAGAHIETDIQIGSFVVINIGATVTHEAQIGDYVSLGPSATLAGGVQLGEGVELGAAATVIPRIKIGAWTTIGAGATVIHDIEAHQVAVGVPARPVRKSTENALG